MELINNFGIQPVLLIAQIINFLVIFFLLKKYVYKPVLTMLKNREETIREGLKQAEESKKLLEESQEKERELLRKAQAESRALLDETKKQTQELMRKSEESARIQSEAILKEAREQIAREAKDTEKRLAGHVSELALEMLQSSLNGVFSERDQEIVVEHTLKRMKGKTN